MAATAMEVSTDALLAGTGLTGGGGSQVLDQSTLNAAYGRQGNWENFFMRILRFIGVQNPGVKFNAIIVDPSYRNIQSLATAWQSGLFDAQIMQTAFAEQVGIEAPGAVPEGVLIPNNDMSEETNIATSQGNSGPGVGDFTDGNNDLRDLADNPR
jgi:hypothetical protein